MRTIDGDDLVKRILEITQEPHNDPIYRAFHIAECRRFAAIVQNAPELDYAPVVHGRWEPHEVYATMCSACHSNYVAVHEEGVKKLIDMSGVPYCPICGAKMDLEDEAE